MWRKRVVRMRFATGALILLFLAGGSACDRQAEDANQARATPAGGTASSEPDEPPSSHTTMLELLEDVRQRTPDDARARQLRARLAALPDDAPIDARLPLLVDLGQAELDLGWEREAIDRLSEAYELLPEARRAGLTDRSSNLVPFHLGVAYMRLGETQNCCLRNSPESCILPIRRAGIHVRQEGSRRAIECFTEVLANTLETSIPHLEARWLLNVAYMTVGEYPQGVPENHLIPPSAFESPEAFPSFTNIASRVGIDTFSLSGGAIVDDFDGDGYLDLVVSTWDVSGQIRYHRNNRDGTFTDRTKQAGLEGLYGGLNLVHADYDNDGDVDFLVLRGAWLFDARHPNSLVRNNGDGTFTDVTLDAGLGGVHYPTQTASWADYDNDGDLDLYVGNETSSQLTAPCQLFRNNDDGTFTDVAIEAGVANLRLAKAVIWGDYDDDRYPDLYVSNLTGANRLYHNNGDGTFTDVATSLGVAEPRQSFPAWFWDIDNDGALDLFVTAYAAMIGHLAAAYLDRPVESARLARLYHANGRGGFKDVAREWGLLRPTTPMGSNFGDLDNDGYLDFYLGTGDPAIKNIMPNAMFWNRGGERFVNITTAGGFGHLQKGHAIAFADLDNDGDQDIFEQMGGAVPADRFNDALYENPGFGNHWITIQLVGVRSNRSAIGARIRVDIDEGGVARTVYKHVNSGGTFGGNPLRQTIGLGGADRIERLEVFWPTTGETQRFADVPRDRFIRVIEGEPGYTVIELDVYRLGGQSAETSTG